MKPASPIAWSHAAMCIAERVADLAQLARTLQAIGLVRESVVAWGDLPGWPPPYERFTPWRARFLAGDSGAARGLRTGDWSADALARMDAADDRARAAIGERNRALRDAPIYLLSDRGLQDRAERRARKDAVFPRYAAAMRAWCAAGPACADRGPRPDLARMVVEAGAQDPPGLIGLNPETGEWRTLDGAARGDGLPDLAAFIWDCGRGRATARIARLLGVALLTDAELARRIAMEESRVDAAA